MGDELGNGIAVGVRSGGEDFKGGVRSLVLTDKWKWSFGRAVASSAESSECELELEQSSSSSSSLK